MNSIFAILLITVGSLVIAIGLMEVVYKRGYKKGRDSVVLEVPAAKIIYKRDIRKYKEKFIFSPVNNLDIDSEYIEHVKRELITKMAHKMSGEFAFHTELNPYTLNYEIECEIAVAGKTNENQTGNI